MSSQGGTYVRVAPSPRLKDTESAAPAALVQLRVQHLLPQSTERARLRVQQLKKLFTTPSDVLLRDHATAQAATLHRLRLVKSVRNIRVQNGDDGQGAGSSISNSSSTTGALCLPFYTCAALPAWTGNAGSALSPLAPPPPPGILTGSVDGLLTLWDAEQCTPLCSQSTYQHGQGWGRVKSIAVYPSVTSTAVESNDSGSGEQHCFAFTASMFQREVRVWRIRRRDDHADASTLSPRFRNEEELEEEGKSKPSPAVSMEPVTTATIVDGARDAGGEGTGGGVGGLQQVAVDPTGALLAATHSSGLVHLWDARTVLSHPSSSSGNKVSAAAPLQHLVAQDGYETAGATLGLVFHPDGSLLTTTDAGGRLVAWDTRSGQLAFHTGGRVGGHLRAALCVAWSPCGVRLATGGADGVVHLYDARKLTRAGLGAHHDASSGAAPFQLLGHDDAVTSLSFYPNPLRPSVLPLGLVTTSLDHTLRVWDADTGLCVRSLDAGMPLYSHCRPACQPLTERFAGASAVVAVGHGKNWLQYDVGLRGEVWDAAEDAAAQGGLRAGHGAVEVKENDIVASARGAEGGMHFTLAAQTMATTPAAAKRGVGTNEEERDSTGGSSSSEEEEEDEMMALMKAKPTNAAAAVAAKPAMEGIRGKETRDVDDEEEEESSEDEMEMLKKK